MTVGGVVGMQVIKSVDFQLCDGAWLVRWLVGMLGESTNWLEIHNARRGRRC
jgi:hypothetical protein